MLIDIVAILIANEYNKYTHRGTCYDDVRMYNNKMSKPQQSDKTTSKGGSCYVTGLNSASKTE